MGTNIAIFQSDEFDRSWPVSEAELEKHPWGEDCAKFLMKELASVNMPARTSTPIQGEGGWSFTLQMPRTAIKVFVMWAPIGDPPRDYWVVQVRQIQPFTTRLFQKRVADDERANAVDAIGRILTNQRATAFRWISEEEFRKLY